MYKSTIYCYISEDIIEQPVAFIQDASPELVSEHAYGRGLPVWHAE